MQIEPQLETVCAWCHPNKRGENITHGICPAHQKTMLAQAKFEAAAFHLRIEADKAADAGKDIDDLTHHAETVVYHVQRSIALMPQQIVATYETGAAALVSLAASITDTKRNATPELPFPNE